MSSKLIVPKKRGVHPDRLTDKQTLFIEKYLADNEMNGGRAAISAGYKNKKAATKLLNTPIVAQAIGKAIHDRIGRCQIEADDVLKHLANALYLDPLELFEPRTNGVFRVKDLDKIPVEIRRCISKIKTRSHENRYGDVETVVEIEFMSKDAAMQLAMKHLGLITDGKLKVEMDVGENLLLHLLEQAETRQVVDSEFIAKKLLEE